MLARQVLIAFSIITLPLVKAQFVSSLPQCVQNCIDQSQDDNCSITDVKCLCRASAGNFLPDLVTCMHGNCDNNLDNDILLTPLQFVCEVAGTPIPESAIKNAENQASSLASQQPVTTTVTMGGSSATGISGVTTTVDPPTPSISTVTVTSTESGSVLAIVYPLTEWKTTTISGSGSTVTSISTSNSQFGIIPVIIVTTDSTGSTYTSTTSESGTISTYTTTDSQRDTITQTSTYAEATTKNPPPSSQESSSSDSSATIVTTSVAAGKTSSSDPKPSKTSTAASGDSTDSAPFTNTNAAVRPGPANLLGLIIFLTLEIMWA